MRAVVMNPPGEIPHPAVSGTRIRVYVWDLVVRNTHWIIALTMAILVATGLFMRSRSLSSWQRRGPAIPAERAPRVRARPAPPSPGWPGAAARG